MDGSRSSLLPNLSLQEPLLDQVATRRDHCHLLAAYPNHRGPTAPGGLHQHLTQAYVVGMKVTTYILEEGTAPKKAIANL